MESSGYVVVHVYRNASAIEVTMILVQEVAERAYTTMVLQQQFPAIPAGYETCAIGTEYTLTPYNACIKVCARLGCCMLYIPR